MRVLVNYSKEEKESLPILASLLKKLGIQALATSEAHSITGLLAAAGKAQAQGIILCNEETLGNCVQTANKTGATLANFRGSRLNFSIPAIVIAPLFHLHAVKYGRFLLEKDLTKLLQLDIKPVPVRFKVLEAITDFDPAVEVLKDCLVISIDIETDSMTRITCISFTGLLENGKDTISYIIPFVDFGLDHFTEEDMYAEAILCMQDICALDVPKMMFNATYDTQYLIRYHAYPRNLVIDVMGLQHAQYAELPKDLAFTASLHCYDYYFWKSESALANKSKDIRGYWGYCVKDSWYTLRCFLQMMKDYPAYAIKNYQLLFKLTYPYLYCAFEGWLIDNQARQKLRQQSLEILDKQLVDIKTMANYPDFNPNSPKQVGQLIYNVLGAKIIKKTATGQPSTNETVLKQIGEQHPLLMIVVDAVLSFRQNAKAISTYYDFIQMNGRLLYSQSPFATDTGRSNSQQSNFSTKDEEGKWANYGAQIQNIPPYAKEMLIADEGYTLIEPDNSKSEARCVAYLSNCKPLKDILADTSRDFYKSLGLLFFGIPYEQVTKELRNDVLKHVVHASNYLAGADATIVNMGIRKVLEGMRMLKWPGNDVKAFVRHLLEVYHKPFPEIRKGYVETKREILRTSKLTSVIGYTRYFFGDIINDHKILRGAVAHAPQNLSVTILNKGFWKCYKLCCHSNGIYRLKAQIHDSLPGQVLDSKLEEYRPKIIEAMTYPVTIHGDTLVIPVEWKSGKTWKAMS